MLTRQDSFRLGFLLRCAEEGCTIQEVQDRVKLASALLEKRAFDSGVDGKDVMSTGWNAIKTMATLPLHLSLYGIGAGAGLGAIGGYGLAKLQNSDIDPEEAKRHELMAAYKLQAEMARRRAQQYQYRQPTPSHFG